MNIKFGLSDAWWLLSAEPITVSTARYKTYVTRVMHRVLSIMVRTQRNYKCTAESVCQHGLLFICPGWPLEQSAKIVQKSSFWDGKSFDWISRFTLPSSTSFFPGKGSFKVIFCPLHFHGKMIAIVFFDMSFTYRFNFDGKTLQSLFAFISTIY